MSFKIKNISKKYYLDLLELRNDKETRRFSINKKKIDPIEHKNWLDKIKKKKNQIFIILSENKIDIIGYTRFKIFKRNAEVSLAIHQKFRNKGLSKKILLDSEKKTKAINFVARVNCKNLKSIALFKSAGYDVVKKNGNFIKMRKMAKRNTDKYYQIIQQIENLRKKNNSNWMDILRIAFRDSPKETAKIMSNIYNEDSKISKLSKKLSK